MTVRLEVTLFWYRPHYFCCVNQVVLMLACRHLNEESREVCMKARSPTASLAFIGQVTKHITVKWPIALCCFVKTSLRTKPVIWKRVSSAGSFSCASTRFHNKSFASKRTRFETYTKGKLEMHGWFESAQKFPPRICLINNVWSIYPLKLYVLRERFFQHKLDLSRVLFAFRKRRANLFFQRRNRCHWRWFRRLCNGTWMKDT